MSYVMIIRRTGERIRKIPAAYYIFALTVLAFCALFTAVEMANGKFWTNDLRVYYEAQQDFFNGNDPYVRNYGLDTGYFKYPPFTLYLFSFFCWIPYPAAQLLHVSMLALSFIISVPLLKGLAALSSCSDERRKATWILYMVFLMTAIHLTREFHLGNVNLILLLLFTLGLHAAYSGKPWQSALFWALMAVLKPIMILAFVTLPFMKKWKEVALLCGFGVFFFLFPVLHKGWEGNLHLWAAWLGSISKHGDYIVSENSLSYLAEYYFGIVSAWWPSLICFFVLLGTMAADIYRKGSDQRRFLEWTVIFAALVPNFFVTDTEHFLLSAPLLTILLYRLSDRGKWFHWTIFGAGILLFSFNSNDLLGRKISDSLDAAGILGIGNLLFILCMLLLPGKEAKAVELKD